jgi:ABC-type glycerol-3-phosphate transport system permease component
MAIDITQIDEPTPRAIPARTPAERARRVLTYAILIAVSALFFVPFLWTISTSLKTLPETTGFDLLPNAPSLRAYREVLTEFDFLRYAANSFFLAAVITLGNLVLCSVGGYAFARLRFPGREVLFMLVLATLMIPDQLRLVPVFVMLSGWGLVGSFKGYMLIKLVLAANLFFMRQYFLTIPRDFEEAAKLDNAGHFKTFRKVMLPLAGPALAAITILTFQGIWNEFFWPLILLGFGNPDHYTVQLGIAQFSFQYQTLWPQLMAASVIAILPIVIIFLFFQRYFVAGVVASGVKG